MKGALGTDCSHLVLPPRWGAGCVVPQARAVVHVVLVVPLVVGEWCESGGAFGSKESEESLRADAGTACFRSQGFGVATVKPHQPCCLLGGDGPAAFFPSR